MTRTEISLFDPETQTSRYVGHADNPAPLDDRLATLYAEPGRTVFMHHYALPDSIPPRFGEDEDAARTAWGTHEQNRV